MSSKSFNSKGRCVSVMVVTNVIASNQVLSRVFFGSNDRLSLRRVSCSASQSEQILTELIINGSISNIFLLVIVKFLWLITCVTQ